MKAHAMTFRKDNISAMRKGVKKETRRLVTGGNSFVLPGMFDELDLSTARARVYSDAITEIRARCELPSGPRVVTVSPKIQPRDLLWVRPGRGSRRSDSRMTLTIRAVHARRLQDMTDEDAIAEGVMALKGLGTGTPRDRYALLWDEIHGSRAWNSNPWVWVYRYRVGLWGINQRHPELSPRAKLPRKGLE